MNRLKLNCYTGILTFLLLVLSTDVSSQTKREVQFSLDTLYKSHMRLMSDYNKLVKDWKQYDAFYRHVKALVLEKQLINEPIEKGAELIDEAWNKQLLSLKQLEDSTVFLTDSLMYMVEQNTDLLKQNELYLRLLTGPLREVAIINTEKELIGTWHLYLNPMQTTGEPFKSGLISHNPFTINDSLHRHNIYQIDFLPEELANIHFKDGRTQKCFYEVKNFNSGKPYTIVCSKQDEFKVTMHVSPMPTGLEVSYEIPVDSTQVLYYNGVMKP